MNIKSEQKKQAIELRKEGLSYSEIKRYIPVSKGLLSYWFKNLTLTPVEEQKIVSRSIVQKEKGKLNLISINKKLRLNREIVAFEEAKKIFNEFSPNKDFLIGITLYWAEGAKKHNSFQFVNSDPDMIVFMNKWILKYLKVEQNKIKYRLFMNDIPEKERIEYFWANKLGIEPDLFQKTIYRFGNYPIKRESDYKGCLRLSISSVYVFRLVKAWQKLLIQVL